MDRIIEKTMILYEDARRDKYRQHEYFDSDNYKWILGKNVFNKLETMTLCKARFRADEKPVLYGINILCDWENPDILELWERKGEYNDNL